MIPFGTKELHHQKKVCEMTMEDDKGNLACIGKNSQVDLPKMDDFVNVLMYTTTTTTTYEKAK